MDADSWDDRYRGREYVWTTDANRFLVSVVGDLEPGRALDLATGEGRNAVWLSETGWTVTAVDFSTVGVEKARRLAADRGVEVEWICTDVLTHVPEPEAYDLVTVLYLHLPRGQLREVLRTAASALAREGTLLAVGHDRRNLVEGHGGPQDPGVLWDPELISGWLSDEGLAVTEASTVERPVETEDGTAIALDSLVTATRRRPGGDQPPSSSDSGPR